LRDGMTVLDMGGQPMIWDSVQERLKITILNLPGIAMDTYPSHHDIQYVEGDACNCPEFKDKSFDFVFSNSVIEHVGDSVNRQRFAKEVVRIGKGFWIQTPSCLFPVEAHTGMPFWWLYPQKLRDFFIERWRRKLPAWTEMVEGTTYVTKGELQKLFPQSTGITEKVLLVPKSNTVFQSPSLS
jgi:2-polyprenyl-3-methyl-5-hydroxy-6-metoxy-1,4-benzoquinol methylase